MKFFNERDNYPLDPKFVLARGLKKGFTLIELLVIVAIVATLTVVILLLINPGEVMRQARDASRISDLGTLKRAITIYMAEVPVTAIGAYPPGSAGSGSQAACFVSASSVTAGAGCGGVFSANFYATSTNAGLRAVNGNGWVPINLTQLAGKSPIAVLPIDPVNNAFYYYAFAATSSRGGQFKLAASGMESTKYGAGGSRDVVLSDGGQSATAFEIGTNLDL